VLENERIFRQEFVETPAGTRWVSTCDSFDHGWETLVCPVDRAGEPLTGLEAEVFDRYPHRKLAAEGHVQIIKRLKEGAE
jgi:hypothetical protein